MKEPTVVTTLGLPFLLSVPKRQEHQPAGLKWPLLIFLHGLMEGPPTDIRAGVTAYGPLSSGSSALGTSDFIVAAPQLPARGDIWGTYSGVVSQIAVHLQQRYDGDPHRSYLTGFSFGGNGVFDIALAAPSLWAALWPVDPTRVPQRDPMVPLWLSAGEVARPSEDDFVQRLALEVPESGRGDRVYVDKGLEHVPTAIDAYSSDHIYRWLLSKHR